MGKEDEEREKIDEEKEKKGSKKLNEMLHVL